MKKTKLVLFTLCLISVLVLIVSCSGENYNEGFSVKTPARATATNGVSDSTSSSTTSAVIPSATPTLNEYDYVEDLLPTQPPVSATENIATNTPSTQAPSNNSETPVTSVPTQQPTQKPVSPSPTKFGIDLPPIWF